MSRFTFVDIHATDVRGARLAGTVAEERVRESVLAILDSCVLCSIATVTPAGQPHVNSAYFSFSDALELYFLSHPDAIHCRNLSVNPSAAVTVFSTAQHWTDPDRGLQLFGTCEASSHADEQAAERSYRTRFDGYDRWHAALANDDLARQYRFYRFAVTGVKILDEKRLGDGVLVHASVVRQ